MKERMKGTSAQIGNILSRTASAGTRLTARKACEGHDGEEAT